MLGSARLDPVVVSRLLFEAREIISMHRDGVEHRTGQRDDWSRRLIAEIEEFRAVQGWTPHGFGMGPTDIPPRTRAGPRPA